MVTDKDIKIFRDNLISGLEEWRREFMLFDLSLEKANQSFVELSNALADLINDNAEYKYFSIY